MSIEEVASRDRRPVAVGRWAPNLPADEWAVIEGFVLAAVAGCEGRTPCSTRVMTRLVSRLTVWAYRRGLPLEPDVVFRRPVVGMFIEQDCAQLSKSTRGTYRSRLLRMGEVLAPEHQSTGLPGLNRENTICPYSPVEQAAWRSWAAGQPTAARRMDTKVLLALGLGAGLTGGEIGNVRHGHITVDDDGVLVHVVAGRARAVPVLATWEPDLIALAHSSTDPETFAFRLGAGRPNPNVINHFTKKGDHASPSTARMRTTWITGHLAAGVPARALLDAAGVQGFDAFARCVSYLPAVDLARARSLLRGAG